MGLYDSLYVGCLKCGSTMELQSKAGDCSLSCYSLADAPTEILIDLNGNDIYCEECGFRQTLLVEPRAVLIASVVTKEDFLE